jgi:N-acyl-D-amino-acid deacylase
VWREGKEKGLELLKDPQVRKRLKKQVAAGSLPNWSNLVEASGGWNHVLLANAFNPEYDRFRDKSIAYIGKQLGKGPADVAWDIVLAAQPKRARALYFMISEPDIETALRFPWTSIGSDAGASDGSANVDSLGVPHPRAYGNFPRVIAKYVRERHVITLEDAVRKMTSWPASRMGLFDRGAIREGMRADVTVFDYEKLKDTATYQNPMSYAEGVDYVLVNGQLVIDLGHHTGARPGSVLRGNGFRPPS